MIHDPPEGLCLQPSKAKWNFVRTWYCSRPEGHSEPHIAWDDHTETDDPQTCVAWFGPWEDGSFFVAPEWAGIEPWQSPEPEPEPEPVAPKENIHSPLQSERDLADRWRSQALAEIDLMDEDDVVARRLGLATVGLERLRWETRWTLSTAFRVLTLIGVTPSTEVTGE